MSNTLNEVNASKKTTPQKVSSSQIDQKRKVKILVATMSGNARDCANELAAALAAGGREAEVLEIELYSAKKLLKEKGPVLICTSTFGNGEPPDCAYGFWEVLQHPKFPNMPHLEYSVLALGDSTYPKFCLFGKDLDDRLRRLGAKPIHPQISCDVDFEESFQVWMNGCLKALL
ncbi:MAG: flavodoxin domain-containing protein [Sumerlaeia bacterium]